MKVADFVKLLATFPQDLEVVVVIRRWGDHEQEEAFPIISEHDYNAGEKVLLITDKEG